MPHSRHSWQSPIRRSTRLRPPSFVTLSSLAALATGHYLADLIAILASIDPVMGDCDR